MTCWEVLGIGPTADRRRIKKAYASRLKRFHPEDDPDGFGIVRSAYEEALSRIDDQEKELPKEDPRKEERQKVSNLMEALKASLEIIQNSPEPEPPKAAPRPRRARWTPPVLFPPTAEQKREARERVARAVEALMKKVRDLEKRPNDRYSEHGWAPLLEGEVLWDLDLKSAFQSALLDYLGCKRPALAHGVWRLFEQRFRWVETARDLYESHETSTVDWVLERIREARSFRPARPKQKPASYPPPLPLRLIDEQKVLTLLRESMDFWDEFVFWPLYLGPIVLMAGKYLIELFQYATVLVLSWR